MKKEQKIHKLIEEQNRERKNEIWENDFGENAPVAAHEEIKNGNTVALNIKRIIIPAVAVLLAVAVALILVFAVDWGSPLDDIRYCSQDEYYTEETNITLKEYSEQSDKNLLYFDWYDFPDFLTDYFVRLNDTEEIIGFQESGIDLNTGYSVLLSVSDNKIHIDSFDEIKNSCDKEATVNGISVSIAVTSFESQAAFEYGGHLYYIQLTDCGEEEVLLDLLTQLLPPQE